MEAHVLQARVGVELSGGVALGGAENESRRGARQQSELERSSAVVVRSRVEAAGVAALLQGEETWPSAAVVMRTQAPVADAEILMSGGYIL